MTGPPDRSDPPKPDPEGSESGTPEGGLARRYRYKRMGAAYQGAMESVLAIVIGTGAGYWADGYFDTSPWLLAIGATIGFAAFVLRLTRIGAALDSTAPAEEPSKDDPKASG